MNITFQFDDNLNILFPTLVDQVVHVCHRHLVLAPQLVHLSGGVVEPVLLSRTVHRLKAGTGTPGPFLGTFPQGTFHSVSLLRSNL